MHFIDLTSFPVWLNLLILLVAGTVVWLSGTRLAHVADKISVQTGLSHVLAGALLLGAATSLPEIGTTVSASLIGNATLAVNNLFGGVAMQLAVLALIDFWFVRNGPLTFFSPAPVLLLGGVLLILQIAFAVAAIAVGDVLIIAHVGVWPVLLLVVYLMSLYFMNRFPKRETWTPTRLPEHGGNGDDSNEAHHGNNESRMVLLYGSFATMCLLVLAGGWTVSTAADVLSEQTGIGSGFIGATLVAIATSLPEVSTTAGAVRRGAYTMAISNIFGTNTLEVALLLPSDLGYRAGAVVNAADGSAILLASLGIIMTSLYLWGLLERRDKSVFGMGVDSWWVLIAYVAGLTLLYFIT
ncbi:MAG: sodium:calcium antiporter [Planctomycetota bacterium]|nr:MAG: sodium:calcium antiporter [Planctomycetota bacterium]REK28961.1 MAG: sodium:calcium antiporter [Planctomycetota bacterium]REK39605.1 MAG: sodium:calcium antiporter [Planctomycetota bacterium]